MHELQATGIEDPVTHFRRKVEQMNDEAKHKKADNRAAHKAGSRVEEIDDATPLRWLEHFALRAIWAGLDAGTDLAHLQLNYGLRFDAGELLEDLACAGVLCPRSEGMAYQDVLPRLAHEPAYTDAQINDGLAFLGREREKVIEILGDRTSHTYPLDTSRIYYVGIGSYRGSGLTGGLEGDATLNVSLLFDAACVPLGMDLRIGGEDEGPRTDETIANLGERYGVEGRIVRVSDGLGSTCANAISDAVRTCGGYLALKSAGQLDEREVAWVLSEEGWQDCGGDNDADRLRTKSTTIESTYRVAGEDGAHDVLTLTEKRVATFSADLRGERLREIGCEVDRARRLVAASAAPSASGDSARFVRFEAAGDEDGIASASLDHDAIERARTLAGCGMLVTSELTLPDDKAERACRRLRAVAGAFGDTRARLEDTSAFAHEDAIAGHLVVCHAAVLLMRLLETHVLDDRYATEDIIDFTRAFEVVRVGDRSYVNLARRSEVGDALHEITRLPINLRQLTTAQRNKILSYRLKETRGGT